MSHSIIPSTSVGSDESIGLRDGLPLKGPIELRGRDSTNRKKRATVMQRLQEISAPHDLNFTPELLSKIKNYKFLFLVSESFKYFLCIKSIY